MPYTIPKGSILGQRGVAAVLAVCCGPCRLLCWGGWVPSGGKHILIAVAVLHKVVHFLRA